MGIAAIQIATAAGAEIFATAGSLQKREFLKNLGVQHVMDSRSLAFADEVMDLTGGKGVDIVLNSLAAEQEQLLVFRIKEQVAKIMGIAVAKLDIRRSLLQLGLDSLMAVELSNRLKSESGVNLSTMKIMQGLSISQLAEISLEQLALASIKLSGSSCVGTAHRPSTTGSSKLSGG